MDPANNTGTQPADQTSDQDDQEWADALDSYSKDRGIEPAAPVNKDGEGGSDGKQQTDEEKKVAEDKVAADKKVSEEAAAKKTADEAEAEKVKTETSEQTKTRHDTEAAETKRQADAQAAANIPDNPAVRETRQTQREIARQEQEMKEEIRRELFSDKPTQLLDADGDPIKTIEDVQQRRNSVTGKAFTEEEAAAWLLKAQKNLNEQVAADEKEVERIATVNLDLHDQADAVKARFGALMKSMPDVAKKIVTKFNSTLKTDPKTGFILDSPNNMEDYFELALEAYALQDTQLKALNELETKKQQEEKEAKRKQTRQDRSDVYGSGKIDTMDDEEKEWADVAKSYYKNR